MIQSTIAKLEHRLRVAQSDLRDCSNPKYPHLNTAEMVNQTKQRIAVIERDLAAARREVSE
jgi:hypothetical protein